MATNDPFGDFRRRRGEPVRRVLLGLLRPALRGRPGHASARCANLGAGCAPPGGAGRHHATSSRTPRASFFNAPRSVRSSGAPSTLTPSTCSGLRCRTTWLRRSCATPMGIPQAIAAQVEDEAERGGRTDVAPSLSPEAKGALLGAFDEMRELGSSYLGPEHVLLALARDTESDAGRLLARFGLSHTALRGAVIRGVDAYRGGRAAGEPNEDARRVQPRPHRGGPRGQARPGDRARRRDRGDDRDPLPAHQEQPRADRRPGRRQDRDRRGHRTADRERRGARDAARASAWSCSTWPAWWPARSTAASSRSGSSR